MCEEATDVAYPRQPTVFLSDDHDAFRATVASFVDREIRPHADEWEAKGQCSRELYTKAAAAGLLAQLRPVRARPSPWNPSAASP